MSAFGDKADMAYCGMSLSRSLLGAKRTWLQRICRLLTQSGHGCCFIAILCARIDVARYDALS
jgi:hypothetical protein